MRKRHLLYVCIKMRWNAGMFVAKFLITVRFLDQFEPFRHKSTHFQSRIKTNKSEFVAYIQSLHAWQLFTSEKRSKVIWLSFDIMPPKFSPEKVLWKNVQITFFLSSIYENFNKSLYFEPFYPSKQKSFQIGRL